MVELFWFLVAIIVLGTFIRCIDFLLVCFIWIIKVLAVIAFFGGLIWFLLYCFCK